MLNISMTNIWLVCVSSHFLKSSFLSRGENTGSQTQEVLEQVNVLKAQISELEAQEKELDNQKAWLEDNIKHLNHDPITRTYPWHLALNKRCFALTYFEVLRFHVKAC